MARIKKVAGLTLTARSAIVFALVTGLTVFMLPGSLLGIEVVSAQAAGVCPGPVAQTSAIAFINPSSGMTSTSPQNMSGTPEVSAKPKTPADTSDPESSAYHINAWGSNLPPNPVVQYFYFADGDSTATPIGFASRVGSSDTFEFFWQSGDMPDDGAYTLCAVLSNLDPSTQTATPVASATQDVIVNNLDPTDTTSDQDPRGDTVEITYPRNAGTLATYTPPNPTHANPAPPSNFIMDVKVSPGGTPPDIGTIYVKGFYSLTPAGANPPTWKECAEGYVGVTQDEVNSFICTLAAGDSPSSINAVGAIANDTPGQFPAAQPQFDDSTDGHRVGSHVAQIPTNVSLNPSNVTVGKDSNGDLPCRAITATVTDQEPSPRPIGTVNVDVHATGPTNSIRFDIVKTSSAAPQNHLQDPAYDCKNGGNTGLEGDHPGAGGNGLDVKHIESTDGTTASGYVFMLHSADEGTTSLMAWADTDDDDVAGANDPTTTGSITWAQTAPSTTPSESSSGSPSESPSNSSSSSPSGSTSPSSSPSQGTIFTVITELTINYSRGRFHGRAKAGTLQCREGRTVTIKRKQPGRDAKLGTELTKGNRGKYELSFPGAHGKFYAKVRKKTYFDAQGNEYDCTADRSPTIVR